MTPEMTPEQIEIMRSAGKTRILERATVLLQTGKIALRDVARVLAAYRRYVQGEKP